MKTLRIFLLVALIFVVFGVADAKAEDNTTVNAPDFTLKDTDGLTFNLSDYEDNKTIVMLFMFSTCSPTENFVKEALGPYSEKMDNDDVAILSVSVFGNDNEQELRDYAESHRWRHALGDRDIEIAYDVDGTPTIFIIDKNGKITYSHLGSISQNKLEEEVYNATLTDEETLAGQCICPDGSKGQMVGPADDDGVDDGCLCATSEDDSLPPISLIPALISIGLIAIYRRK